jgi:hypothetical protein
MVFWTDDNTRESPTTYDMDGEGTPVRQGDIIVLHEHTLYCEGFNVIRPEDYQIILTPDSDVEILLSFIADNGLNNGANWKYEAAGPPPPSWRVDFNNSRLGKALRASGISFSNIKIGAYGATGWTNANTAVSPTTDNMDGSGTDLASGDTINITKTLVVDKSVGCGTITAVGGVTVNSGRGLTLDAGVSATFSNTISCTGIINTGTASCTFSGVVTVLNGGTLGSDMAWTADCNANLTINTGGTFRAPTTTGLFTMSGAIFKPQGTFANNNGTMEFDRAGTTSLGIGWTTAKGITIDSGTTLDTTASNYAITGNGVVSITGTIIPNTSVVTFNAAGGATVTVNNGGTLGGATAWTYDCNVNMTTSLGGTFSAPTSTGSFTFSGTSFTMAGTFTDNTSTMTWDGSSIQSNTGGFTISFMFANTTSNLTLTSVTMNGASGATWDTQQLHGRDSCVIQCNQCVFTTVGLKQTNGLIVSKDISSNFTGYGIFSSSETPGVGYRAADVTGSFTLKNADVYSTPFNSSYTLGAAMTSVTSVTTSTSTTFSMSSFNLGFAGGNTLSNAGTFVTGATLSGGSASTSLVQSTGTWTWNSCSLGLMDIQFDITTPGTGKTITIVNNITIDGCLVTATDTLTCTVAGVTITEDPTKFVDNYGTLTLIGTTGNNVTLTGFELLTARGGSTQNLQYVTLTQGAAVATAWQWIAGAAITHTINHVDLTHVAGNGGIASTSVNTKITFTNSSISGAVGAFWDLQDVVVYSGATFQFSNSPFNFVGMQDGTGWVVRNTTGNFNVYGVLGSETPDNGYRASNVTGSFAISQADVYGSVTSYPIYTLGVSLVTTLTTINVDCWLDDNGYNLTSSLGCSLYGRIFCRTGKVNITGTGATFGYSLFVSAGGVYDGGSGIHNIGSVGFNGNFIATSSKTTITNRNITVAWYNGGVFTNSNGSVDFIGQSNTSFYDIYGDNTWYNLQISVSIASSYRFEVSKTQTITGGVEFNGAASNLLVLNSTTGVAKWSLIVQSGAQQSVNFVNAGYSDASGGATIVASHSVNSGNNLNWSFLIGGWGGGGAGGNGENGGNGKPIPPGDQNGDQGGTPPRMSYNIDEEMLKQNEQEYLDWIRTHPKPTYYSSYGWVNEIDPDKVFHAVPVKKKWKKVKVVWIKK